MKSKMILPFLAVIFAVAGAIASKPLAQSAYYKNGSGVVTTGDINNTTKTCATGLSHQCTIQGFDAYDNATDASTSNPSGLMKYQ